MKKEKRIREFRVNISQDCEAFYIADFTIEAKNKKEAQKIVDSMTLEQLEERAVNWELSDYMEGITETTKIESIESIEKL